MTSSNRRLVILAVAVSALTACATAPPPSVAPAIECLPLTAYTSAQEAAAGAELAALKPGDPLAAMITDYGAMRAADRACIASQAPPRP